MAKKDTNKKMLQLKTKINHPSLHHSFFCCVEKVVNCRKVCIIIRTYHSGGCMSKERCRDGCNFCFQLKHHLVCILYAIPTSLFMVFPLFQRMLSPTLYALQSDGGGAAAPMTCKFRMHA